MWGEKNKLVLPLNSVDISERYDGDLFSLMHKSLIFAIFFNVGF